MGLGSHSRRRFLTVAGATVTGGFAGCSGRDETQRTTDEQGSELATQAESGTETDTDPGTPEPFDAVDWPTYQYTAGNLGARPDGDGPTKPVTVEWTYDLGRPTRGSLALVDGTLFVGSGSPERSGGGVHAVDAATGDREWTTDADGAVQATPTVDAGLVYVGSDVGTLYALNSSNGSEFWAYEFESNERVSSPDIGEGTAFVGTGGGRVVGIDATTGSRRWSYRSGAGIDTPVAYATGDVYVGDDSSSVHGLQANGDESWTYDTNSGISGVASDGRSVFATTNKGSALALNTNGRQIWEFETESRVRHSPVVSGEWTFFGTEAGAIYGLEEGLETWRADVDTELVNTPVLVNGTLYVVGRDGAIVALDSETGDTEWQASIDAEVVDSTPVVAGGRLYVTAMDGNLYALAA